VRVKPARHFIARVRAGAVLRAGKYSGSMGSLLFASDALSFVRIKKRRGFVILSEA